MHYYATCVCPIESCIIRAKLPAIISSTVLILSSTCWMRPTSVLVCRLRTLLRRMAVNMLQISAWHVTSQWDSSSTMQPMLSASWMMKFISRSNSPPTSWKKEREWRRMSMVWEQGQLSDVKEVGEVAGLGDGRRKKMIYWSVWPFVWRRINPDFWWMLILVRKASLLLRATHSAQINILHPHTHAKSHSRLF